MDAICTDDDGAPFTLTPEDFIARGLGKDGKGDMQGCSEFNPLMIFSRAEQEFFDRPENKKRRDAENQVNRRIMILLYRPGTRIDPKLWPCPTVKEGPAGCKLRFFANAKERRSNLEERREHKDEQTTEMVGTFACRFYDRLPDGKKEVIGGYEEQLRQTYFSAGLKGVQREDTAKVEALILDTLARLAQEGLDPDTVAASLNTIEFRLRERNTGRFPRGPVARRSRRERLSGAVRQTTADGCLRMRARQQLEHAPGAAFHQRKQHRVAAGESCRAPRAAHQPEADGRADRDRIVPVVGGAASDRRRGEDRPGAFPQERREAARGGTGRDVGAAEQQGLSAGPLNGRMSRVIFARGPGCCRYRPETERLL